MTELNTQSNPSAEVAAAIGHNEATSGGLQTVSLDAITVWPPAQEQAEDVPADVIDTEAEMIGETGQRAPVPARVLEDGRIEVVASAYVAAAVQRYNDLTPDWPVDIEVRVFKHLDDAGAYRLLAQQIEPAHAASSLARGRFFVRAVDQFGSEAAVAKACRVSKAAVSKNLDVVRAFAAVGDKIVIGRDIGQRDASWLMSVTGRDPNGADAPDPAARVLTLAALDAMEVAPAKKIFAALRKANQIEKPRRAETVLTLGDREIGRVREKKGRPVRIDLADVGDIELDTIMGLIREALARSRQAIS